MDPINNVQDVNNYPMVVPQQDVGTDAAYGDYAGGNYATVPDVYAPEVEQKKSAAGSMIGMVALGALALGGAYYGYRNHGKVKGLTDQLAKEVEKTKNAETAVEEVTKKFNEIATQLTDANTKIDQLNKRTIRGMMKERVLNGWHKFTSFFKRSKKTAQPQGPEPLDKSVGDVTKDAVDKVAEEAANKA